MYKLVNIRDTVKMYESETVYDPEKQLLTWFKWEIDDFTDYVYKSDLDLIGKMKTCGYELVDHEAYKRAKFDFCDFKFKFVFCYPSWKLNRPLDAKTIIANVAIKVTLHLPKAWFDYTSLRKS